MIIDKNLILHLPFDDPDGNKVYDYSASRNDGTLSGGAFLTKDSKFGKALDFSGSGECLVQRGIPFSSDFTLCFFVKTTSNRLGWLVNFSGIDNYHEKWVDVSPGEWIFFAFIKFEKRLSVFIDSVEVDNILLSSNPVGLSLNDDFISGTYSCVDELKLFNEAKTTAQIMKLQSDNSDVEYYVNGSNFKEFGVYVSGSAGLVGKLQRKEMLTVDWDNYHGTVRDKKRPRFKERTITLDCFIEASSRSAYVDWVNLFVEQFNKEGTQRLTVEYNGKTKPLVYEVVCIDEVDVSKEWGTYNDNLMVGTFKIKLIEDEPVKRVLRHIGISYNTEATIKLTSSKLLNIYWGDGTYTYNVSGNQTEVKHKYEAPGEYDIIVSGVIEDIQSFETNCIVVWDKLL